MQLFSLYEVLFLHSPRATIVLLFSASATIQYVIDAHKIFKWFDFDDIIS